MIGESLQVFFVFGLLGLFTNWIAWKQRFYRISFTPPINLSWRYVLGVFTIYFVMMFLVVQLFLSTLYFMARPFPPPISLINIVQAFIWITTLILIYFISMRFNQAEFKRILKAPNTAPLFWDFSLGALSWLLAFPVVVIVGQLFDLILFVVFQFENYEQVAVRYLKSTLLSPSQLVIALLMIVVAAPCIEEFLFRGCLQNFFKKKTGPKVAILLSSLCFALFHFSSSQGLGNVPLISSLFVFALFLGFIYERQQSLIASISLHMTFNFATCVRILFLGEGG